VNSDTVIDEFLKKHLEGYDLFCPLAGDASHRMYYRVHRGSTTFILCRDPHYAGAGPYAFLSVHELFLQAGLPVPSLIATDRTSGLLLLEDLGDDLLECHLARCDTSSRADMYTQIIDILVRLQSLTGRDGPFALSFDRAKLMYEFDFFIEHYIGGYLAPLRPRVDRAALRREFETISGELDRPEHFVLNHRDFHARNIIITGGRPRIIDYQDARMGLPQYDLVSLLRDSYVVLDEPLFLELRDCYIDRARQAGFLTMDDSQFFYYFDVQAFQRNVKALGTFGYQCSVMGNTSFERSIAPTLGYLESYCSRRPILKRAGEMIAALPR
jgi:aminoglycoside/choline kinase family phosphotransferase